MLRCTAIALKKGWTHNPGRTRRGGKNLAWRPKMSERTLNQFVPLALVHPRRHPNSWQERQFNALGYTKWPKAIGFYNGGDNFELTPEAAWRLYGHARDEAYWSKLHSETTIVLLLPLVEKAPKENMERVMDVYRHYLKRFGADHYIYNAVMQAAAFAKDFEQAERLFKEMELLGLEPNCQSYVNMMLASKLAGLPLEKAEAYFQRAVKAGAMRSVMRVDTEFKMWMDQLGRLGSFTAATGYLSVNEEGAKPMPRDMWALWGWHRSESKFVSRDDLIMEQVRARVHGGRELVGTVYTKTRRQPWAKFNGMLPHDYNGPVYRRPTEFNDAPAYTAEKTEKAF
ncbi:putative mitochondrial RNA binding complex 1 subunit [Leptomonas pyrrhocoris]|uniref:Putative mitochondrial RNA binding complex 1 subunit n=1 Tax=Leptomonas pyrrhocoris TaxID=157538 RepID=A0A0N0DUD1_LEPPY|nr:putative mitochondrial RNA binding complex 1 subunit [Leptomonas pyrrhocoris]KPA78381.1 putative mitochondrial RNA binding complex 1 subunit [Leptomonas pyrrhocoris]|eukprot:XP_015656820.1 putative mitochondrial RNA binding complex 1 subunit [Leptomonas pyrrhocoris]